MKIGHAYAWGGAGSVPSQQAYGGTQKEQRAVAAGGMEYEEGYHPSNIGKFTCKALKKNGEICQSWVANESGVYCQGHLNQLEKLERKIASCEDEAERLLLEEERVRKWL